MPSSASRVATADNVQRFTATENCAAKLMSPFHTSVFSFQSPGRTRFPEGQSSDQYLALTVAKMAAKSFTHGRRWLCGLALAVLIKEKHPYQIYSANRAFIRSSYRENAQLLGRKLKTYPLRPEEQFIQHVEFAAEFPPLVELNLRGAELSFITYFNLDLFAVIIAFAVVAYLFSVRVLRLLSSTLSEAKNKSE